MSRRQKKMLSIAMEGHLGASDKDSHQTIFRRLQNSLGFKWLPESDGKGDSEAVIGLIRDEIEMKFYR